MHQQQLEVEKLGDMLGWKKRIANGTWDSVEFDEIMRLVTGNTVELFHCVDSAVRRSFFYVLEKILVFYWNSSNFGLTPIFSTLPLHRQLYRVIDGAIDRIEFSRGRSWFAGHILEHEPPVLPEIGFVSICIHLTALLNLHGVKTESVLLGKIIRFSQCEKCITRSFLENDERCLSATVALLKLKLADISLPDELNPRKIFAHIFLQIRFDHEVLIEWIHSEISASIFLLRFSKDILANLREYDEIFNDVTKSECHCFKRKKVLKLERQEIIDEDALELKIEQIHGDKPHVSSFIFAKKHKIVAVKPLIDESQHDKPMDAMIDCLIRFRFACERMRLSKAEPFNMKPVIQTIEAIEKCLEDNNGVP